MSHNGHSAVFSCSCSVTNENHHHYKSSIINMYSIKLVKASEGIFCSWYNIKLTKTKSVTWSSSLWALNPACPPLDHNSFKCPVTWFTNFIAPQSTKSPASLDRPIGAIFECLIGSKRPVYTSQLQYSVKVATSSYTVQSKYMLVYPGSSCS